MLATKIKHILNGKEFEQECEHINAVEKTYEYSNKLFGFIPVPKYLKYIHYYCPDCEQTNKRMFFND